jgi:hypothetical protein
MLMWIVGIIPQLGKHLPDALQGWGMQLVLEGTSNPAWGALGVSLGLIAAALVGAVVVFRRQEI